ncbi:carcinoembryonic antigen-related cell adhesion molecule 3-like [Manis pentadactyla]|uniref:carcinoembryonic antigen-related cell adhesion molecule 3-like n=1 Tax=Manis pentadactyla TaxID=143292 RepID=UPI00255CD4B7|nr:carcinoembryonic antigen-related cell adhesion molecule 3-like [Manis pentadactyla]
MHLQISAPPQEDRGRKAGRAGTWGRQWSERFRSRSSSQRGRDRPAADTLAPPTAPAPRGLVPWQGLLLAVSLLTWNLLTTAQLAVESVPPNAVQGQDVLLLARNPPESLLGYAWYKGDHVNFNSTIVSYVINTQAVTPGIAYSSRETIYLSGSLLFQNVTQEDTGYYTLQALHGSLLSTTAAVQLGVYRVRIPLHIKMHKTSALFLKEQHVPLRVHIDCPMSEEFGTWPRKLMHDFSCPTIDNYKGFTWQDFQG